jgi:dTDP-4-dehydrorhamnose reductase
MTYAKHLADQFPAILELPAGIYHCAAENDKSTYESACYIAKALGASEEQIQKIIVPNHERYKDRFRDYRLDSQKLTDHGIFFGKFEDNVAELLGDFKWLA